MENFLKVSVIATIMAVVNTASEARQWKHKLSMSQYSTHYFENQLDHFNEDETRTYQQRYWYNDKYQADQGPAFLYICGEWTCTPPDDQMFPMMVGAEHGALLYSLEHRYYGDSQPFEDWSTDNLKWLSSEQALADIAKFIEGQNEWLGYEADWIVIGGSYPGALSAWFKSQYPDHAVGAWSSSGVIHPIKDFKSFDLDIFMRADEQSPQCSHAISEAVRIAEDMWSTPEGQEQLAEEFGIQVPLHNEFWYLFADAFAGAVQYGTRRTMCDAMIAAKNEGKDAIIPAVAAQAQRIGLAYDQYSAISLANTTIDINSSLRQWTYQICTEFGFFMTPSLEQPMRSHFIDMNFWPDYCNRVFDKHMETETDRTNEHYGGLDIEGDNIFFINGSQDPWQFAAMRDLKHPTTTQSTMSTAYVQCDTCAHCVDFATPQEDQAQSLTDAQNAVADEVAKWLSDAQFAREQDVVQQTFSKDEAQIFLQ